MPPFLPRRAHVGVLELRGIIGTQVRPPATVDMLHALEQDTSVHAVLLDIDSPGGTAAGSDAIRLAVVRLRQKKPVVAYVRTLGASGAYLIACAATRILALPSAIVGSIGVISVRPRLEAVLERLGVKVSVSKAGRLKDAGAFWREPTPEEEAKEQALVDAYYRQFVEAVAQARNLSREKVVELATGEVFLAEQAKELGLVDALGDWEDAVQATLSLGGVPRRRLIYARPRRGLAERLLGRFAAEPVSLRALLGARALYLDLGSLGEYL